MSRPGAGGPGLAADRVGAGPAVVLVHGVGLGPATFAAVAGLLADAGRTAVVVHRPGYGRAASRGFVPLDAQVDELVDLVEELRRSGPVGGVVGVSGGATLALLLAIRLAAAAEGDPLPIVAHEPLVGPLAPSLHQRVRWMVDALVADDDPGTAADELMGLLAGERTWAAADPDSRRTVAERPDLVIAEARAFAAVAPTPAELDAVRRPGAVITTVGMGSPGPRWEAAAILADLAGARTVRIPGSGHVAQVDAARAFARLVLLACPLESLVAAL
jgi:pimeloyl-ACP methyl ester carboxylesterase